MSGPSGRRPNSRGSAGPPGGFFWQIWTSEPKLLASIAALITAIAAAIALIMQAQRDDPPPQPTTTVPPTSTTLNTTTTTNQASVMVECKAPTQMRPGQTVTLTYEIVADKSMRVGLGAGFRDEAGQDQSTGTGDVDDLMVSAGRTTRTRIFPIPTGLAPGIYELTAEIWRPNQIGRGETLAEGLCGFMTVS